MYIAIVPNRNSPPAILLRESIRIGKKVKTRTLANLSSWKPERVDALRRALAGEFDDLPENSGSEVSDRCFGILYALKLLADELGISAALGKARTSGLALFLTLARVAHQGSRLSAVRWADNHAVPEVLGLEPFDEHDLYETLDWIESQQTTIETALYQRYINQSGKPLSLVLYDVTSSYLEGQNNELAEFGYNRDGKRGKKSIVIGLLSAPDGEPLAVRVFKGNTTDNTTVADQINLVKQQFGVHEIVFVGDRGMLKSKQKKSLSDSSLKYITALTDPQVRKLLKRDVLQPELFDHTIHEVEADDRRLILRRNQQVQHKEQHRREDKLKRLQALIKERNEFVAKSKRARPEAGLAQLKKWVSRHKLASFVQLSLADRQIQMTLDATAKADDELLDGCYVLETDVSKDLMDKDQVDARYRDLQKVERDFRTMKTALLEVRPIFLRKGKRTKGHVFVAMLALKIVRYARARLVEVYGTTDDDAHALTLEDALATLANWTFVRSEIRDVTVLRLPKANEKQRSVLEALGLAMPRKRTYESHSKPTKDM